MISLSVDILAESSMLYRKRRKTAKEREWNLLALAHGKTIIFEAAEASPLQDCEKKIDDKSCNKAEHAWENQIRPMKNRRIDIVQKRNKNGTIIVWVHDEALCRRPVLIRNRNVFCRPVLQTTSDFDLVLRVFCTLHIIIRREEINRGKVYNVLLVLLVI